MPLSRLLDRVRRDHPERVALVGPEGQLDYRGLERRSRAVALALRAAGVRRGDAVGVHLPRSIDSVVAVIGALRAGAAYVPIDPAYPAERQRLIAEDADLRALLVGEGPRPTWVGALPVLAPADLALTEVEGDVALLAALEEELAREAPDDRLNILYTSGSTGRPKGVVGTRGAMMNRLAWGWAAFPFAAGEVVAHRSSLNFVDAGPELFSGLLQGVPTAILSSEEVADLPRFVHALEQRRVSRLTVVPSILGAMLRSVPRLGDRLDRLRTWITSGEALSEPLLLAFREALPAATLINLYGTTEVTGDVTAAVFNPGDPLPVGAPPIGRAIAGAELWLLDEEGAPVGPGEEGALAVGGPVLAAGYHRRPQEEAVRFPRHPERAGERVFHTGDRVRWRADGQLEYLGRSDSAVKIRGVRVDLEEIERCLTPACPTVAELAAVVGDQGLVALVTAASGGEGADAALEAALEAEVQAAALRLLPEVMRPGRVRRVDRLPLLPNGKRDRVGLLGLARADSRALRPEERPATPTERRLAALWARLLQRDDLARGDRFSAIGGDSLRTAELMGLVEQEFGPGRVTLGLVRDATLRELAARLDGDAAAALTDAPASGSITLTPLGEPAARDSAVIRMVVEASHHLPLVAATELPGRMDDAAAAAWCRSREGVVIRVDGVPAGAGILQRCPNVGVGVEPPPGAVQLDEWLHPAFQGRGILGEALAWPLLAAWLAERFDTELSVVWEDHLAMLTILQARGYQRLGRSYWTAAPDGDGTSGYCEVWTYDLRPHRAARPPQ